MKLILVVVFCISAVNTAKILAFCFFPSISHQFVFQAIVKELSLRGHEVTFVSPNPIGDTQLTNLTEVDVSAAYQIFKEHNIATLTKGSMNLILMGVYAQDFMEKIISIEMEVQAVQDILKKPEGSYDLILIEAIVPFFYGLGHKFKAPVVVVSSLNINSYIHQYIGNPVHPVLYPDWFSGSLGPVTNIWDKFDSLYVYLVFYGLVEFHVFPKFDRMARKYFGNDMPYIKDLVKDTSYVIANVNPFFSSNRPLVSNAVEVWNLHLNRREQPTEDLQKILDGAKNGVVYFSLGTNVRFEHVEVNMKEEVLKALGELPYTVLCKWESEDSPNRPKNVILRKWLPQQSILDIV